ncbi:Uncharacterised protein [Mycobacterium tuberculosis]|uniref:Uncharacterized protein n=1 Tax=Mycobacterium tuberculosis TaxID=1773 RepID=A0A655AHG2_MYCTX|nr:Uncharacterised protein [Mycobacterium tuberculosis]CKS95059.1 Uncharacterised protein [Mycobacterium tuberculosis]CKT43783.1 Uncharacterised protein [Mycobacterium tuberculosis]
MARRAGCVRSSGPAASSSTATLQSSGAQRVIGSRSASLPSSTRLIAAATVTGLVIDAMRNSVSRCMGTPASISR